MFRAAVAEIDASEGWVKCGHCRKVFDCRENEIKPTDFMRQDEVAEDEAVTQAPESAASGANSKPDGNQPAPQISLFDEPEPVEKSTAATGVEPGSGKSEVSSPAKDQSSTVKPEDRGQNQSPSQQHKADPAGPGRRRDSAKLSIDDGIVRKTGVKNKALESISSRIETSGQGRGRTKNRNRYPSILKNRLNIAKPQAPRFSRVILAKAQTWKKQKNRSKKIGVFPYALISVVLFALFIWQVSVVNYTRLSQYGFLSAPLAAVCSVVTCNQTAQPQALGFDLLHASIRRHATIPNVMSISAKLINFSDENRLIPSIRLDLTNDQDTVIASRIIDLADNPQYVDPALSELAPGQDVSLLFNIENPGKSAHGFQLNLVSSRN